MANTLRIKRRATGNAGAPTTAQCVNAELAFNEVDGILYYGKGGSDTGSTSVIPIGVEMAADTAAFLKTPSSANLRTAVSDETGSGLLVFATNPVLTTPNIGTPSAGTLTNCTGLPISGIASLGAGVGTFLGTPSSANLAAALTDESGSTAVVFSNSPTLVTPTLGAATATSINKVAITAPATSATLVIADGKTLTASNTLTFTGTDSSSVAFGAGGTVPYVDTGKTNSYGSSNTFFLSETATFKLQRSGPFNSLAFALDTNDDDNLAVTTIKTSQIGDAITVLLPFEDGRLATQADVNAAVATAIGYVATAKYPARVATTANITLSGVQTIDGVAVVAGDRVLVKNQTAGANNGIYVVAAGAWVRPADLDTSAEMITGISTYVVSGTSNGGKSFVLTTTGSITLGTTALTFENLATAVVVTARNGLTRTGSTIDVTSTGAGSLTATANSINLTSGIATAGTYRSVTVDTYGRVTGGTTPTTFTGYGISDTSANLAAAITDETGSGLLVFATNPVLTTPNIGTPSAGTLTNCTGLPISGIASLGAGVGTFLGTPSSANLAAALTDETGSATVVFSTSPTFTTSVVGGVSFDVFNTTSTTINAFGAATAATIGYGGTAASTTNISTGTTAAATTRAINIGTGGTSTSTTNIALGSSAALGTTTINSPAVVGSQATVALWNSTTTTINAFGAATAINIGAATGTTAINNSLTVAGNLTVNGTTTILNTNTLSVDDKNIEIGTVVAVTVTCNVTSGSAVVTNLASTQNITVGSAFSVSSGFVSVTVPAVTTVASIDSLTQITLSAALTGTGSATGATAAIGGATDTTANLGGITLKGLTDKTIIWDSANANWTSSENWNIASGKVFKINNVQVLSATALGSAVVGSSLTSVGTIISGVWTGTAVAVGYGGTGLSAAVTGLLKGNGSAYSAATAGTDYVIGGTTTVGKLIAQASVTTGASVQITAMTAAPSAPVAGDLWNNSGSLRFYNGAEKTIAFLDSTITGNAANVTGTVAIGNGGTGQITAGAAFNALSPVTTLGDLIYGSAANTNTRLAGNTTTTRKILAQTGTGSVSAAPVWEDPCTVIGNCTLDGGSF